MRKYENHLSHVERWNSPDWTNITYMLLGEVHGQCKCEMCGVSGTCANCFGHVRVIALRCVTAPMDSVVFLRAVTKCVSRSATNPSARRHNLNSIFVLSEAQQTMNRPRSDLGFSQLEGAQYCSDASPNTHVYRQPSGNKHLCSSQTPCGNCRERGERLTSNEVASRWQAMAAITYRALGPLTPCVERNR